MVKSFFFKQSIKYNKDYDFFVYFSGTPFKGDDRLSTLFLDLEANSKQDKKWTVCFVVVWLQTGAFNKVFQPLSCKHFFYISN